MGGIYRTSRCINWFLDAGFDVTVIRAGLKSDTYNSGQIEVIQIKHTISILNKIVFNIADKLSLRILKLLWNKFVYYTTIPDDLGGWSKKVSKSDAVIEAAKKANLIISTSPPNS